MEPNVNPPANLPTTHACLISTNVGQRAPRLLGNPPYPPVIVRSDRQVAIKAKALQCQQKYPDLCRQIYPGCQTKDLFDDYDIHVEEGKFLDEVILYIAAENISRVKDYARNWSGLNKERLRLVAHLRCDNPQDPLSIVEQSGLFRLEHIYAYGREFLWHALNEMKRALALVAEAQIEEVTAVKLKEDLDKTSKQASPAVDLAPSSFHHQDRHISDNQPQRQRSNTNPFEESHLQPVQAGNIAQPLMSLPPMHPEVRRIRSGEQSTRSYTPRLVLGGTNLQRPLIARHESGAMSMPQTPTFYTQAGSYFHLSPPPGLPNAHLRQPSGGEENFSKAQKEMAAARARRGPPSMPEPHLRQSLNGQAGNLQEAQKLVAAGDRHGRPAPPHIRQLSSDHAENARLRGGSEQRSRQTSTAAPTPGYSTPVETVRMQGQSLRPSPSQNQPTMAAVPSNGASPMYGPTQHLIGQPFGPQMPMTANPNLLQGIGIQQDAMPISPAGPFMYQSADATNVQYPNGTFVPINVHTSYFPSVWAVTALPAKQPQLYNPYGEANPSFAQTPQDPHGKGKRKSSLSGNPNKTRKHSSSLQGLRGGQGQYSAHGQNQQNAVYQGPMFYGTTQHGENFQKQTQSDYRGPRKQDSQGQWPLTQGSRHPSLSRPQGMEPFPTFENQPFHSRVPSLHDHCVVPSQPSEARTSGSRPSFTGNAADTMANKGQEGLITKCTEDWIDPSATQVRDIWVHGIPYEPDPTAELKKLFEEGAKVSVVRVDVRKDRYDQGYAYIHFNTNLDAQIGLKMDGSTFANKTLTVKVPQKYYLDPAEFSLRRGAGPVFNGPRHHSDSHSANATNQKFQGRSYGFVFPKQERTHRRSSQDPTQSSRSPTYSPQDARSDMNQSVSHNSFANQGSPEMKKGKKSGKLSPNKRQQTQGGDKSSGTSQSPSPSPIKKAKNKRGLVDPAASKIDQIPSHRALVDEQLPVELSETSEQTFTTATNSEGATLQENPDARTHADQNSDLSSDATESLTGSDASTVVALNEGEDNDDKSRAEISSQPAASDVAMEPAEQQSVEAVESAVVPLLTNPMVTTSSESESEPGEVFKSDDDNSSQGPILEVETTHPVLHDHYSCHGRKKISFQGPHVAIANQGRDISSDNYAVPPTPMNFTTAPQTPMEPYYAPGSPDPNGAPKDDLDSDGEEQKHDNSFVSAKESQSDGESETQQSQTQLERQGSALADKLEVNPTEVNIDTAALKTEQPITIGTSVETQPVPDVPAATPTTSSQNPKSNASQTESLHPFAKTKKPKEPARKKVTKKKAKGKETQVAKGKDVAMPELRETISSELVLGETKVVPKVATATSAATRAEDGIQTTPRDQGHLRVANAVESKMDQDSNIQEEISTKMLSPESRSENGKESVLPSTVTLVPTADNSLSQATGAAPSYEPVSSVAFTTPPVEYKEIIEASKEKERRRKAIAAKVAIPNLNLGTGLKARSTEKSITPDPQSPVKLRNDSVMPNEEEILQISTLTQVKAENASEGPLSAISLDLSNDDILDEPVIPTKLSGTAARTPASSEVDFSRESMPLPSTSELVTQGLSALSGYMPPPATKKPKKKNKKKPKPTATQSAGTSQPEDQAPHSSNSLTPISQDEVFSDQFKEIDDVKSGRQASGPSESPTSPQGTKNQLFEPKVVLTKQQLEEIQTGSANKPPESVIDELNRPLILHSSRSSAADRVTDGATMRKGG